MNSFERYHPVQPGPRGGILLLKLMLGFQFSVFSHFKIIMGRITGAPS